MLAVQKGPLAHCNSSQMGVCLSDFVLELIEQDWCNQCLIFVIVNWFYDLVSLNVASFPVSADVIEVVQLVLMFRVD